MLFPSYRTDSYFRYCIPKVLDPYYEREEGEKSNEKQEMQKSG